MAAEAITQAIAILAASPVVVSLCGNRITPLIRPQDIELPAITLQRIATLPSDSLGGDEGLDSTQLKVDSWATTYADARALADAVRAAFAAAPVRFTLESDEFDDLPAPGVYRLIQEYQIWS